MKKSSSPLFDYHDSGTTKRKYGRTTHGGVDSKGRRKEYRPLSEKKWIHLTLKSEKAKGPWSFLNPKNQQIIREILKSVSSAIQTKEPFPVKSDKPDALPSHFFR